TWSEERLAAVARQLPDDPRLRRSILTELIKVDLRRRWERGLQVTVETYLMLYPELGGRDRLPVELLLVEHETRQRHQAPASLAEFSRRFPNQAEELRRRLSEAEVTRAAPSEMNTPRTEIALTSKVARPRVPVPDELPEQF